MRKIDDVFKIDIFYDGSFKIHCKKFSRTFDKDWVISVNGDVRISQTKAFFGERIEISPNKNTLSCTVVEDNNRIICKEFEKGGGD